MEEDVPLDAMCVYSWMRVTPNNPKFWSDLIVTTSCMRTHSHEMVLIYHCNSQNWLVSLEWTLRAFRESEWFTGKPGGFCFGFASDFHGLRVLTATFRFMNQRACARFTCWRLWWSASRWFGFPNLVVDHETIGGFYSVVSRESPSTMRITSEPTIPINSRWLFPTVHSTDIFIME